MRFSHLHLCLFVFFLRMGGGTEKAGKLNPNQPTNQTNPKEFQCQGEPDRQKEMSANHLQVRKGMCSLFLLCTDFENVTEELADCDLSRVCRRSSRKHQKMCLTHVVKVTFILIIAMPQTHGLFVGFLRMKYLYKVRKCISIILIGNTLCNMYLSFDLVV